MKDASLSSFSVPEGISIDTITALLQYIYTDQVRALVVVRTPSLQCCSASIQAQVCASCVARTPSPL
eukprot:1158082-Pelagomonas_calceolata.AAC.4